MLVRWPWIWLPLAGPIRLSTVLTGLLMVVAMLWRHRGPLTALITLMAWLSAYEIAYQATGTALHGWSPAYFFWLSAAISGWVVLGLVRGIIPNRWLLLAVALVWAIWLLTGFHSNSSAVAGTPGRSGAFSISGELLNELSKTLLGFAYLANSFSRQPGPARASR